MESVLTFPTALGPVFLAWSAQGIRALRFVDCAEAADAGDIPDWIRQATARIAAHLDGDPQDLTDLPLDLSACTPYQRRVADVLRATRPGQRLSYGDVALLLGQPGAARAVGQAVKRNPILLLVPCHRVVSASGEGGWSAFGSLTRLRRIRGLERHTGGDAPSPPR